MPELHLTYGLADRIASKTYMLIEISLINYPMKEYESFFMPDNLQMLIIQNANISYSLKQILLAVFSLTMVVVQYIRLAI